MAKKQWVLIVIAVVLAVLYIHYFTNWFKPKTLRISYTARPSLSRSGNTAPRILFGFGGQRFSLSEIKVVPLAAWQTNQAVAPLWHLVANSRSVPVEFFSYGQNLRGMKPAVLHARAEPLQSNVVYRLFVRTGSIEGQCDFQLGARPSPVAANRN